MIRFVPNEDHGVTDASYHLPAFYELWARWGPKEDRAFWARAADVSREMFYKVTGPGDRPHTRSEQLRHDAAHRARRYLRGFRLRLLEKREQLVGRLFLVEEGSPGNRPERPDPELSQRTGNQHLRRPLHARRQAAFRAALSREWWRRLPWAAWPLPPALPPRHSSKSYGIRPFPPESSATTTACCT